MARRAVAALTLALLLAPRPTLAEAEGAEPSEVGEAEPTTAELVSALSSPSAASRVAALQGLAATGDPAATAHLARVLETDPSPEVRGWAARAMGGVDSPEARVALSRAAHRDRDARVRSLCRRLAGLPEPAPASPAATPPPPPAAAVVQQRRDVEASAPVAPPVRQRRPGRGLILGGWITLGVSYGISAVAGMGMASDGDPNGWYMLIPLLGPGIWSTVMGEDDPGLAVLLWFWSAAEVTGLVLLAVGYRARGIHRREQAERERRRRPALYVSFAPSGPGGSPGLSAMGVF